MQLKVWDILFCLLKKKKNEDMKLQLHEQFRVTASELTHHARCSVYILSKLTTAELICCL